MQMILGPTPGPLTDEQLVAAYPWPRDRRWLRAMMVTTLDGAAAGADGLSGSISSDADQAVFSAVRRLADVVLIGAGTLRAERYQPMRAHAPDAEARADNGQASAPRLAVVSRSLDLPWSDPVFSESTLRPLVITAGTHAPETITRATDRCELVVLPGEHVAASPLIQALEERGLRRIVCEGGPILLDWIVTAGLVDEADITVAPLFAGTQNTPRTPVPSAPARFTLAHLIEGDGFLMTRYLTRTESSEAP